MTKFNTSLSPSLAILDQDGFVAGDWEWSPHTHFSSVATTNSPIDSHAIGDSQPTNPTPRVSARTLDGGLRTGVQVVRLTTSRMDVEVVLSRGAGLSHVGFDGVPLGWQSPVAGPVHPSFVPLYRPDGLGWLAGFDEVLARCGLLNVGGPQFNEKNQLIHPLHGDIAYWPCQHAEANVDQERRQLILTTRVEVVLFHFYRLILETQTALSLDEPRLEVRDTVHNGGGRACGVLLLHHWNFGPPVASTASRLRIPAREVAPRNAHAARAMGHWNLLDPPTRGAEETVYFFAPLGDAQNMGTALLVDGDRKFGLQMKWDLTTMPHLTVWKNPVAAEDGYAVGIEPGTCFPNGRPHETSAGRVVELQPGQSLPVFVTLTGLTNLSSIEVAEQAVRECQSAAAAIIHSDPQSKFGPIG